MAEHKPMKTIGQKPQDITSMAKTGKSLEKSIYDRELEDLIKLPNERGSPMKY